MGILSWLSGRPSIDRIDILDAGILLVNRDSIAVDRGLADGIKYPGRTASLIQATTSIPAQLGISFGFRYRIVGAPTGAPVDLRVAMKFPHQRQEATDRVVIGDICSSAITFDDPQELFPGTWVFEIRHGGRLLAVQSFQVYLP